MNAINCHLFPVSRIGRATICIVLAPSAPAIRRDRGRVMLGLFDTKRDGFDACALGKKRIQKWLGQQARYRGRFCRALPKLFQQGAALVAGTAGPKIDCSCAASRYGRHGNLEVDGTDFCRSTLMKIFFKAVLWMAATVAGLVVWNMATDFRPLVASILAAAFVCYVLSVIVEVTVKRVISDEQLELRSRLEVLDRKVTAILRDAFERRSPR